MSLPVLIVQMTMCLFSELSLLEPSAHKSKLMHQLQPGLLWFARHLKQERAGNHECPGHIQLKTGFIHYWSIKIP